MKTKKIVLCCLLVSILNCRAEVGEAKVTFQVVDDFGNPVSGATVGISMVKMKNLSGSLIVENVIEKQLNAVTDKEGKAVLGDLMIEPEVYYSIFPLSGYYYTSGGKYRFNKVEGNKWQPWNPTVKLVLRQIINPIPAYARIVDTHILKLNERVGYDLMAGDWIAPAGKGQTADLLFELSGYWKSVTNYDSTLKLIFSNPGDGIQSLSFQPQFAGSEFRSPREAPLDNYLPELMFHRVCKPELTQKEWVDDNQKETNYIFRVRTVLDEEGHIKSALYGKIYDGIKFGGATARGSYLKIPAYYLNSDPNSRNMEFDPKRNLFKNLKPLERVTAP